VGTVVKIAELLAGTGCWRRIGRCTGFAPSGVGLGVLDGGEDL
jgi:hypothetical protein